MTALRFGCFLVTATLGCRVYDEGLLHREDATVTTVDTGSDLGAPLDTPTFDIPIDRALPTDTPDVVVSTDTPVFTDVTDVTDVTNVTDVTDARVAVDATDAVVGPVGCDSVNASGLDCIEAVSGHRWSPDDRRLIAPGPLAVTVDRVLVGDLGSARVMAFDPTGNTPPTRAVGTGLSGETTAPTEATRARIASPTSLVNAGESVIIADAHTHSLYRWRANRVEPLPFGVALTVGPLDLAWAPDTLELFASANNQIFTITLGHDGSVSPPTALVGRPCGPSCMGFDRDASPGLDTALSSPTGLVVDTSYVWFADRDNCRVRRFRRSDPLHTVETFVGASCNPTGDLLAGVKGDFAQRATVRLGAVTDLALGADGSVYILDDSHCAVLQVLASSGNALTRVVAGSRHGCGGATQDHSDSLGRLGGLASSADGTVIYFTDRARQRVGTIANTDRGGTPRVSFPGGFSPGIFPARDATIETLRLGRPTGLAVQNPSRWVVTTAPEGRLYQVEETTQTVTLGLGAAFPTGDLRSVHTEALGATAPWGVSMSATTDRVVVAMPELGVITALGPDALERLAGQWTQPGLGTLRDPGTAQGTDPLRATLDHPINPFSAGTNTWFGDRHGRVWQLRQSTASTTVLEYFAGAGTAAHGGVDGGSGTDPDGGTIASRAARLGEVTAVTQDRDGVLYVADRVRRVVWSFDPDGNAAVIAGILDQSTPTNDRERVAVSTAIAEPAALAYDGADTVFIADRAANRVRAYSVSTRTLHTVVGSGPETEISPSPSGDDGPALSATLAHPVALAWDGTRLLIAESASGRVRALRLAR